VDLAGALDAVEAGALPAVEAGLGAIEVKDEEWMWELSGRREQRFEARRERWQLLMYSRVRLVLFTLRRVFVE
jgi:hypothetical protein